MLIQRAFRSGWSNEGLRNMTGRRNRLIGAGLITLLAALGIGQHLLQQEAIAQSNGKVMVPKFEVDPFWPKPMPNNWVFGQTIGLGIDEKDQVWIIHRGNDPGNLDRTEMAFPPPVAGRGGAAAGTRCSACDRTAGAAKHRTPTRRRVLPARSAGRGVQSRR
jgi:hypothetical protein